jgi:hypothetical protein
LTDPETGVFIEDISFTNSTWITESTEIPVEAGEVFARFDSASFGAPLTQGLTRTLKLNAILGGRAYSSPGGKPVTVSGSISGFDNWAAADYPLLTGGFDGDPDGDGIRSGIEYAFGLNPTAPSKLSRTPAWNGSILSLTTPLDYQRPGVLYQIERSSNLSSWTTTGNSVTLSGGQLIGTAPSSADCGFVRWKIVEP